MRNWIAIFRRVMPITDFLLVIISFRLAYILRYDWQILKPVGEDILAKAGFEAFIPYAVAYALWLILTFPVAGLYREQRGRSWFEEAYGILNGATSSTVMVMALNFLLRPEVFSRLLILEATTLVIVSLALERIIYRWVRLIMRKRGAGVERVLVAGADEVGRTVLSAIIARPDLGYSPVGYLDDRLEIGSSAIGRVPGLGDLACLESRLKEGIADLVIITLPWVKRQQIMHMVAVCDQYGIQSRVVPDLFQLSMSQVTMENLEGIPLLGLTAKTRMTSGKQFIKRLIDISIIVLSAPITVPLAMIIGLAIKLDSPGPALFPQRRVGKDGREFDMYKFRSMCEGADGMREELIRQTGADPKRPKWENDPRITRVGKLIRRLSIDELPQLINILRGEMSLVGPRPPTPNEVAHYEPWHRQRLNTYPGLTSLWQISGRSKVPFEEQCLLDIYYIENWSIGLDFQIMLRSIPNVLLGNGAY